MSTFLYEKHLPPKKRKLRYELKQGSSYQDFPSLTSKEQRICERTEAQNKNGKSAAEETINAKSRVAFDDKKRVNMVTSGAGCEYLDNGMEVEDKSTRSPISKSNNKKIMAPMKMASTKKGMAEGGTSGIDYKQNSWMTSYNDKEISALANDDALQAENRNAGSFTNLTRTVGRHSWNKLFHKSVTWGHKRSRSGAPRGIIKHPTATTSLLTAAQENIQSKTGSRKFDFALNDNKVQELEEALVHQPSSRKVLDFDLNELRVMEEEADQPDKFSGGV
ncbi:hypothetical protein FRX31_005691 [Thalictrum thalictroides]|uniref:Uncharacterized protein n=1 Tax=Thalictrum thalictroides TaxID=46969 RepID=A0A7J6X4V9_THATH|nr:hypothetical protein FRX31_005691 [Thalictrum thalictroides]